MGGLAGSFGRPGPSSRYANLQYPPTMIGVMERFDTKLLGDCNVISFGFLIRELRRANARHP